MAQKSVVIFFKKSRNSSKATYIQHARIHNSNDLIDMQHMMQDLLTNVPDAGRKVSLNDWQQSTGFRVTFEYQCSE